MRKLFIFIIFSFLFMEAIAQNSFFPHREGLISGVGINYGVFNQKTSKELFRPSPGIRGNIGYESKFFGGYFILDYFHGKTEEEEGSFKYFTSGIELRFFFKNIFLSIESGKFLVQEPSLNEQGLYDLHHSWMRGVGIGYRFKYSENLLGELIFRANSVNEISFDNFSKPFNFGRYSFSLGIFF